MYNKREVGINFENTAVNFLLENGFEIVERNFFCTAGEIDIIAKHDGYLVFIEVKYRKDNTKGEPEEAVGLAKQRRIIKVAKYYLMKNKISTDIPIRFDVVAILGNSIKIIKNAFEVC